MDNNNLLAIHLFAIIQFIILPSRMKMKEHGIDVNNFNEEISNVYIFVYKNGRNGPQSNTVVQMIGQIEL